MRKILLFLSTLLTVFVVSCSTYDFGDASKRYCRDTSPEGRDMLRLIVSKRFPGMSLVDYCAMLGIDISEEVIEEPATGTSQREPKTPASREADDDEEDER